MDAPTESPDIVSEPEVGGDTTVAEIDGDLTPVPESDSSELIAVEDEFSLSRVLEAILFASQKPVSLKELQTFLKGAAQSNPENPRVVAFAKLKEPAIRKAFDFLQSGYASNTRTFELRETATGWQLVTKPHFAPWLRQLFPENRPARLSAPAVETLAIIAYRQPITRGDIEAVRGVAVDGVMQSLLDRELVKIAGRSDLPGRPLLYETTQHFMEHFGLKTLEELPNGAELRRVVLPVAAPEPVAEAAKPEAVTPVIEGTAADTPGEENEMNQPAAEEPWSGEENVSGSAEETGEETEKDDRNE